MKLVDVKMENVELVGALANLIEHQHIIGDGIADRGRKTKRRLGTRHELGRGQRVATGKERELMTLLDQLLG